MMRKTRTWFAGGLAALLLMGSSDTASSQDPPPPPPPPVTQVPPPAVAPTMRVHLQVEQAMEEFQRTVERMDWERIHRELRDVRIDRDLIRDRLEDVRWELAEAPEMDFEFDFEAPELDMELLDLRLGAFGGIHRMGRSELMAMLEMTPQVQGDPATALFNEAKTLLFDRRYEEARAKFQQLVEQHPRSSYAADAEFWAAYSLEQVRGRTETAFKAYEAFVEAHPESPFIEQARASMVQLAGRLYKQGMSEYKEYIDSAQENSEDEIRLYALQALIRSGDVDVVSTVGSLIADGSASSRLKRQAVQLLRRVEDPEAVGVLERTARSHADPAVRTEAIEALGNRRDKDAYNALTRLYQGEPSVNARRYVTEAVGDYRGTEQQSVAAVFLARVAREDPDSGVREEALGELVRFAPEVAMPHLAGLLEVTPEVDARRMVLSAIARSEDPSRVEILAREARSGDERVRRTAVDLLGRIDGPAALDAIIAIANTDAPEAVRMEAIEGIGNFEGSKATAALIAIARSDASVRVRRDAVDEFGDRMDPAALTALQELAAGGDNLSIREEAIGEMQRWGSRAVSTLERIATGDVESRMRREAVQALGGMDDGEGWEALARIYKASEDPDIRRVALDYLWRVSEERSMDTVIDAAKTDADTRVRRHAVELLGRSDSPRARQALQEILNLPPRSGS